MERGAREQLRAASKHLSPDGALSFQVVRNGQETALGFSGYPWHTHGDILAKLSGLPIETAIENYVKTLLDNKAIIGIATVDGSIRDIWIVDNPPPKRDAHQPANEFITYRLWDGTPVEPT